MNDQNLQRLLQEVMEEDPVYLRARTETWERLRIEFRTAVPPANVIGWRIWAAAASVALLFGTSWYLVSNRVPQLETAESQPPSLIVEIVSTADLPRAYVEIDDTELHRIFPDGIVVAYGKEAEVFTFGGPETPLPDMPVRN